MCFSFFILLFVPQGLPAEANFTVEAGSSKIDASVSGDALKVSDSRLKQWVQKAADAVVAYYGRYSVPHLTLQIRSFDGRGVRGGQTFSRYGCCIRVPVGAQNTQKDLQLESSVPHHNVTPNI